MYKICAKISRNSYKSTFRGKCVTFTINTRENFTNYFSLNFDRLSIYDIKVDQVLANYNGYYRQESGNVMDFKRKSKSQTGGTVTGIKPGVTQL